MAAASRTAKALLDLAQALAAHDGASLQALSGRALGKGGFFDRLARGGDCETATAERVLAWFDAVWPEGLAWPVAEAGGGLVVRRAAGRVPVLPEPDDDTLAQLAHLPIWTNGRRPAWWDDLEVRSFLTRQHRQMSLLKAAEIGRQKFGDRCPRKSAIHEYWARLDKVSGSVPRPPKAKKEAA